MFVVGVVLLVLVQFVPYGRDHSNPSVAADRAVVWPSARVEGLVRGACYDCHSNETEWRWYSNVAPMSWLVQRDVDRGRGALNFSDFVRSEDDAVEDLADVVEDGEMPPRQYVLARPAARLSAVEKAELIAALEPLAEAADGGRGRGRGRSGDDD